MKCRTWPPRLPIYGFISVLEIAGCGITNKKNKLWADYGNFHYGAVGYAAGIPAEILHIAAGAAQEVANTSLPVWGHFYSDAPFGDDPRDQFWIKQGIDYVKQHHY